MAHLEIIGIGFATVLGVLAVLWLVSATIGKVFVWTAPALAPGAAVAPAVPAKTGVLADSGVPAHHLAVIAGAAAAVLDRPFRIVRVTAPAHWSAGWAHQGKFESFTNYRVAWDRVGHVSGAARQRRKLW